MATPNQGCSSRASRSAATASSTSRARASWARTSGGASVVMVMRWSPCAVPCQGASVCPAMRLGRRGQATSLAQLLEHPHGRPRVGEGGGAHLHGRRAGEQELDGIDARRHPADADDRQVRQRRVDVVDGPHRDRVDGRPRQAAAPGARAEPVGPCLRVDGHAQHRVDERERLGAGVERGAGDVGDVGDVGAELGPHRAPAARRPRPSPSAVAGPRVGEQVRVRRRGWGRRG